MTSTLTAGNLLVVDRLKSGGYRTTRLYPAAVAILNLFFCAYFERYLKDDANGFYLSLFMFLESTLYAVVSSINFHRISFEILSKSRIFPATPSSRLLFVITGNLRRPIVLSLVGSNIFFLIVLFRHPVMDALIVGVLFAGLIIVTEILLSTLMLTLLRRSIPSGIAAVFLGFLLFALLIGSFIFHVESLLAMNPLLRWTIDGILSARHSDTVGVLTNITWLGSVGVLALVLGKRFA